MRQIREVRQNALKSDLKKSQIYLSYLGPIWSTLESNLTNFGPNKIVHTWGERVEEIRDKWQIITVLGLGVWHWGGGVIYIQETVCLSVLKKVNMVTTGSNKCMSMLPHGFPAIILGMLDSPRISPGWFRLSQNETHLELLTASFLYFCLGRLLTYPSGKFPFECQKLPKTWPFFNCPNFYYFPKNCLWQFLRFKWQFSEVSLSDQPSGYWPHIGEKPTTIRYKWE